VLFRNREGDVERLDAIDHSQRRIVGLDCRAGENQAGPDDAGERRFQRGVGQLQAGQFGRRLVGLQRCRCGSGIGPNFIDLFVGDEALCLEGDIAFDVGLGLGEQRLVLGDIGLGLQQAGLVVARVELDQDVALLDVLPLGVIDRGDLAVEARFDGDALVGFGPPDNAEQDRHHATFRQCQRDRNRPGGLGARGRLGCTGIPESGTGEAGNADSKKQAGIFIHENRARSGVKATLAAGESPCLYR